MPHLIIGALAASAVWMLVGYAQRKDLPIRWWGWVITALGLVYGVAALEVIVGFLMEGAPQASLVMGLAMGIPAVILGVLIARFIFSGAKPENTPAES